MKRVGSFVVGVLLAFICIATSIAPASAATAAPAQPQTSSSGLSITPRKNYVIRAGQSVTDKLTVGNLNSSQPLNITLKPIDFTFTNESGTPKLMLADNAPLTTWSLKPFMTLPQSFTVPAGQSRTVNYTIKIPANQGAGSYYSALQYASTGANGGNVDMSASGVTLVFVSVPGTVNENLTLKKLGAYQQDSDVTGKYIFIALSPPQNIAYTLANNSNVAESPAGSIVLHNQFFGQKITIDNANPNSSLALIGQTRLFTACIQMEDQVVNLDGNKSVASVCKKTPHLLPGRYSISLDIFYGQNGNNSQEITGTAHFWYLPWWFILIFVAVVAVIAFFVWRLVHKIRIAVNGKAQKKANRFRR